MEILRGIIVNELNNHQDLSRRDELIIRLCHQLSRALQNHAEMKKSENQIGADLEDMKEQMQQFSFLVHKYKDSIQSTKDVKHSLCQTDQSLSLINFDESLEVFRRQEPMLSNSLSKVFYENNKDFSNKCDAAVMTNGISENSNVNIDKMLIDQMRELEEKFHSERQSYLAENDRLNMVIEENHKTIDELKRELKKSKPPSTVHATINNSNSILDHSTNKDYSRLPGYVQQFHVFCRISQSSNVHSKLLSIIRGILFFSFLVLNKISLFDWPIEESIDDQVNEFDSTMS